MLIWNMGKNLPSNRLMQIKVFKISKSAKLRGKQ